MYEKKIAPLFEEAEDGGNAYREDYLKGVDALIEAKRREAETLRHAFGKTIAENREEARREYRAMLGWPLTEEAGGIPAAREIPVFESEEAVVTRVVLTLWEGLPFYGILFRHPGDRPLPLVISKHGGLGTPEICSSFFDSANYNDMTVRLFRRGVNVFAPQTLLWQTPRFGSDPGRLARDNSLRQLGSSIAALEIGAISRALDWLEGENFTDGRFGMAGLSYGGFYTLYTAAAEPRLRASLAVSHFNDRILYNWNDKVWAGSALRFLDAEVGALVCPRYLDIEVGDKDELFDPDAARREYAVLKEYYREAPENLDFTVFDGTHEFCPTDEAVDRLIDRLTR